MTPYARQLLFQLRRRLGRGRLAVWYHPSYRLPLPALEVMTGLEPRRADYAAWWLRERGAVRRGAFRTPRAIGWEDLDRVHSLELLESLGHPDTLGRIFGVDPSDVPADEVLQTVRLACGGTLAAARAARASRQPCVNLLGAFHHAGPSSAGGNCPVNDIAVAIAALRAEGFGGAVAVLDLDAHPPDGLAACLAADERSWLGSISGSDWGPLARCDETVLPEGSGDRTYLETLDALLRRMPRAVLAFVIAGGDVLAGDRLGRLGMTLAGARERDLRVARALEGVASVWLPGGGYHPDAWRVLAGTGMALASRSRAAIPPTYDPLHARFARISADLRPELLGEPEFCASDLEEALGLANRGERALLLGYYTATGLEHALYRYGLLSYVKRLGYGSFRVAIDRTGTGDRARLFGEAAGSEHLLVELILQRRRIGGIHALYVHWLSMRNPLVRFSPARPRLPGQDVPGLGLAREIGEMLALVARRLALEAVAYRPAHFHTAFPARHEFRFVDAARQGRFEAMLRDLAEVPLLEITLALDEGRVRMNGAAYSWEPDLMAMWLGAPVANDTDAVRAERERVRFEIVPRGP